MTKKHHTSLTRGQMSRRHLLKGLGAAAAAAGSPFALPSLTSHAQPPAIPKRLVLFYTSHGSVYDRWRMMGPGGPQASDWEYDLGPLTSGEFSEILEPLHPFRDKLLILDTLSNVANLSRPSPRGHFGGPSTVFTSSDYLRGDADHASGPSVDQIIADQVAVPGRIRSLEYGRGYAVWAGPGDRLPTENDPVGAYRRIFDYLPSDDATSVPTRRERIAAARGSVLDFVAGRYGNVAPRLTGADRARIEAHQGMIRDLESRIEGLAEVTCADPGAPADLGRGTAPNVDGFSRMIATAFSCDITRIASVQFGQMRPADFGAPSGADVHQDFAHHGSNPTAQQWMVDYYRTHASHFANLLGHLDSVPEADGSTLLDNTIVVWAQECGSWVHQTSHLQCIVAGGGGFRMGRYVHYGHQPITPGAEGGNVGVRYGGDQIGPPISRLLVSVARQMGLDVNQIGNLSTVDFGGRSFDLRGELSRLV